MFYFNPLYILISIPALLLGIFAQIKVKSAFSKYSKISNEEGLTGAQAARIILDSMGLYNVDIERVTGFLSDHYDPRHRKLRLSPKVFDGRSIASLGIAAHEVGHAIQHSSNYGFLKLRSTLVPVTTIGSYLGPFVFFIGYIFSFQPIAWIGIILFSLVAIFTIITLPVEIDASNRAKKWIKTNMAFSQTQEKGVSSVLNAAALTYVAAVMQAVSTLLYYILLLVGGRRR